MAEAACQPRPARVTIAAAGMVLALLAGCTVDAGRPGGGSALYVGIVRVKRPERPAGVDAADVSVLGLSLDRGITLGWRRSQWVQVPPGQCSLTIIVRNRADLAQAQAMLQKLEGNPCLVSPPVAPSGPPR